MKVTNPKPNPANSAIGGDCNPRVSDEFISIAWQPSKKEKQMRGTRYDQSSVVAARMYRRSVQLHSLAAISISIIVRSIYFRLSAALCRRAERRNVIPMRIGYAICTSIKYIIIMIIIIKHTNEFIRNIMLNETFPFSLGPHKQYAQN